MQLDIEPGDVVRFLNVSYEQRIAGQRGNLYLAVQIEQPFFAKFAVLSRLLGTELSGDGLVVHVAHLQKDDFLSAFYRAIKDSKQSRGWLGMAAT